jgi:cytochrome c oxidase assembly protein subunit 15
MVPEMTGGVFWEHLHRLVVGGLLLLWGLATWLARKETPDRPWVLRAAMGGVVLLLDQSAFGGLTVIYQLPDLVSTTHLALAFSFLALATWLASATTAASTASADIRKWGVVSAALVFTQSVLGALVRHTDAGMACPDAPLCLGQIVPPLVNAPITIHFSHRVLGLIATLAVCILVQRALRAVAPARVRRWALVAVGLVLILVALGFASVLTVLAVAPVSLHTLVAASLLAVLVHLATIAEPAHRAVPRPAAVPAG